MRFLTALILAVFLVFSQGIAAAHAMSLIRDTEIESYLETWFAPVLDAASMQPGSVRIYLVNDRQINAFVGGGSNVFFHTGLLTETENASEVIGVFAHELGHITGGHLVRGREQMERSGAQALVSTLVGIGAGLLTGSGQAANAVIQGGQGLSASGYLSHSRIQESAADQAALTYLERAELDAAGLKSFLGTLENQELLPASQQQEYARTHPITRNRIEAVSLKVAAMANQTNPPAWNDQHARMKAKLVGFLTPERVASLYQGNSVADLYAQAIAAYRLGRTQEAREKMSALLEQEPNNPFFHELLGQIERDNANLEAASMHYERAVELFPKSGLNWYSYGHVLLEADRTEQAIEALKKAARLDPQNAQIFRLLARAYSQGGDQARVKLFAAEEALLKGEYRHARAQAEQAIVQFDDNMPEYIRAGDIIALAKQKEGRKE